jgi:hypothetical protein
MRIAVKPLAIKLVAGPGAPVTGSREAAALADKG